MQKMRFAMQIQDVAIEYDDAATRDALERLISQRVAIVRIAREGEKFRDLEDPFLRTYERDPREGITTCWFCERSMPEAEAPERSVPVKLGHSWTAERYNCCEMCHQAQKRAMQAYFLDSTGINGVIVTVPTAVG